MAANQCVAVKYGGFYAGIAKVQSQVHDLKIDEWLHLNVTAIDFLEIFCRTEEKRIFAASFFNI